MALTEACKEAVCLLCFVGEIGLNSRSMEFFCENMSAICSAKNHIIEEQSILRFNITKCVKLLKMARSMC